MTDYKKTLNLPETAFPMQANLAKREPEMLARWEKESLYAKVQEATKSRPQFWFVDGPPYANGAIHLGHAVNKTLKDMVVKTAVLDGFHAPFVPGWDCHGLPIELQVEKKFGKVGEKIDAPTFRQKGREYAEEQIDKQRVDFKRLGVLADWEHPYKTMHPAFEAEQLRCLAQIVERGHIVRGFKPVHWCLDCGSSLAEAEVEYEDKKSPAIDVKFAAADEEDLLKRFAPSPGAARHPLPSHGDSLRSQAGEGNISFVIWTTTPWTLPANQAISAHPEFDYVLADLGEQGRVVVAEGLLEAVAKRAGATPKVLATVKGSMLEGARAKHPFADRTVPIVLGTHVTLDAGTGLVHTAPAHGADDYIVGQNYKLPVDNPVASSGKFIDGTPLVAGMHVRKADEPIINELKSRGALLHLATITHSYPHCWRHKTPLIFRATPQWFISMDAKGLRTQALEAIEKTNWIPEWGQARIYEMVAARPDWCISRQRFWGVPLAIFIDRDKQELHPDTGALLRKIADRVDREGLECWFGSKTEDWGVDASRYEKSSDTLDVWFDSGVVHTCSFKQTGTTPPDYAKVDSAENHDPKTGKNGTKYPVFYLEGSDQHRGWFHSSLLARVAMDGHPPYTHVLTHGFTVDEQGRKMSKSLGNGIEPQDIIKTLGADVLRLWVASSDYSAEIVLSKQLLDRIADAYRRIRNTARYLLGNLAGFDPAHDRVGTTEMLAVDRWAVAQAANLQDEIRAAYGKHEFHLVYHKLHNYCVNDLGGLYLDILKDRLYTMPAKSLGRRSAQTAMFHIAEALVRWIAPILSFTADEIWRALPGDRSASVFSQTWYDLPKVEEKSVDWGTLISVRDGVKKVLEDLRIKGKIGSGLNADVALYTNGKLANALERVGEELRYWFITSGAKLSPPDTKPADAESMKLDGGDVVWVRAEPSANPKCERCWHQRADVGRDAAHPTICGRCVENITGAGERRLYI
ncbi:MAG TPA: isoleucine--tRNA ligase [Nevskiaceae bacterium]|nr:isoleucine--tRNA ligase [Nevskiaceae bacterium]